MAARRLATLASFAIPLAVAGCVRLHDVTIERQLGPRLDMTAFRRVLVAGFLVAGTPEIDTNAETVRLLRSQLSQKASLTVIETDLVDLAGLALRKHAGEDSPSTAEALEPGRPFKSEKDLEAHAHVFADVDFWKTLGDEYQDPLVVTGTLLFTRVEHVGYRERHREEFDAFGRRRVDDMPVRVEEWGFLLKSKFLFIDGRTGAVVHTEIFTEGVSFDIHETVPALAAYFALMDRIAPALLGSLSRHQVRSSRVLLR